jgi:MTH538 TIR-like domain (DUF1863)
MAREPVFYSFHYDNDVFRVQQIRNMGVVEGDQPVSPNDWEQIKRRGDGAVERWVDDSMKYKRSVIVLIGAQTASRPWVKYEIKRAWELKKGLFGIYIHNLRCPRTGTCAKGQNPFSDWTVGNQSMANLVTCHDPSSWDAYGDISRNLESWVSGAIAAAEYR